MEKQFLPELIKGPRISLKRHTIDLAEIMYQYVCEDRERLSRFLPWPNFINSIDDEIEFIKKCDETWDKQVSSHYGIYRNSDNEYMGNISSFSYSWISYSCEIGYWILGKFEGSGYMSDAVKLLESTLYETGFNRVVIRFDPKNERSGSIPKRLGYTYEGSLRDAIRVHEEFRNLETYSKLKAEYKAEKNSAKNFNIEEQLTEKGNICNTVLRTLPEWFGIESSIKDYVEDVEKMIMLVAKKEEKVVGFISINIHNKSSAEIHVMGVLPTSHRQGIGKQLVKSAINILTTKKINFLQVKTLSESRDNKEYKQTRMFYESIGFHPLEEMKELWGKDNPCLIMVQATY